MTTTYELYTNENGTPKAVEGKAPAIIERVETLEETLDNGVVTSVNGQTGAVTVDVGVTSFNGSKGAVTYSAPVTSVMGKIGAVTGLVTSVNGVNADASGNVAIKAGSYPTKKTSFSLGSNSATDFSNVTKTVTGLTIGRPVYFVLKFPSVSFPSSEGTYARYIGLQLFSGAFSTASITNGFGAGLDVPILGADFTTYSDGSKESIVYEQCLTTFPCATSISFGAIVKHAVTLEVWQ